MEPIFINAILPTIYSCGWHNRLALLKARQENSYPYPWSKSRKRNESTVRAEKDGKGA